MVITCHKIFQLSKENAHKGISMDIVETSSF